MATRGRPRIKPSVDDPVAVEALCNYLVSGLSMTKACRKPECPLDRSVYIRMAKDPEFFATIMRAREMQQHAFAAQNIEIADKATAENWQVARLRIWARQWDAARMAPKHYGRDIGKEDPGAGDSSATRHIALIPPKEPSKEAWTESLNSPDP